MMIGDDSGSLLGYAFSPRVRASQAGWLVLGLGLIVTAAAVVSLWRGCPVLELNENGIVYTRCLQGMTRIDWSDFDHTEIMRTTVPSTSGRDIELEEVVLHTTDDRRALDGWRLPEDSGTLLRARAGGRQLDAIVALS